MQLREYYLNDLKTPTQVGDRWRPRVRNIQAWENFTPKIKTQTPFDGNYEGKKVFVWSDQHLFHKNIINYCDRPFMNVDEMNRHLIDNYKKYVGPDDICFWVGDAGFKGDVLLNEMLDECPGHKILIAGNHDFNGPKIRNLKFDEIHIFYEFEFGLTKYFMTHYPLLKVPEGYWNIHGHIHNMVTGNPRHINVSVEQTNYRPMRFEEINKSRKII